MTSRSLECVPRIGHAKFSIERKHAFNSWRFLYSDVGGRERSKRVARSGLAILASFCMPTTPNEVQGSSKVRCNGEKKCSRGLAAGLFVLSFPFFSSVRRFTSRWNDDDALLPRFSSVRRKKRRTDRERERRSDTRGVSRISLRGPTIGVITAKTCTDGDR